MRPRSTSMYCEPVEKDNDSEISSDCDETPNQNIENVLYEEGDWSALEDINIVSQVKWQLPKKDQLPFDERVNKISWHKINIEGKTSKQISTRFNEIIGRTRNFRILSEILDEVRKLTVQNECPTKTTPLALFAKDNKEMLLQEKRKLGPNASYSRLVSEKYNNLSEKEKQFYKEKALETVQKHKDIAAQFQFVKKVGRNTSQIDGPLKLFMEEEFSNDLNCSITDIRKKYLQQSKEKRIQLILKFLEVTSDTLSLEQYEKAKQVLTKEEMGYLAEYEKRPKKPSAYNIYMKNYLEKVRNDNIPWKQKFANAANKWKKLSDSRKKHYQNLADEIRDKYDDEFLKYVSKLPKERQMIEIKHVISRKKPAKRKEKKQESVLDESAPDKNMRTTDESEDSSASITNPKNDLRNSRELSGLDELQDNFASIQSSRNKVAHSTEIFSEVESSFFGGSLLQRKTTEESEDNFAISINPRNVNSKEFPSEKKSSFLDEGLPKRKKRKITEESEDTFMNISPKKEVRSPRKLPSEVKSQLNKFLEKRPPESTLIFYTQNFYDGPVDNAKQAYKSLSKKQKDKIKRKFEKAKTKYLQEVKSYVDQLPPNQASTFIENIDMDFNISELDA